MAPRSADRTLATRPSMRYVEAGRFFAGEATGMDELTDDAIAGSYRVWQRRRGHRYSIDDVATAWEAARAVPAAAVVCDLGCGIGSVLLMVAHKLPRARLVGVEAQQLSYELALKNVQRNTLVERVRLIHADLRDPATRAEAGLGAFDLVTGTPPYKPPGTGTVPPDPQRAHARVELRGGVEDYLAAASELVAPGGRVVLCCEASTPERALRGGAEAGLVPVRRRDVVPRSGKEALFSVFTFAPAIEHTSPIVREPDLLARDAGGGRTEAAHALRRFFDLPVDESEAPSP